MAGDDPVLRAALTDEVLQRAEEASKDAYVYEQERGHAAVVCAAAACDAMRDVLVAALTGRPEAELITECCHVPIEAAWRFCQKCGHEARVMRADAPRPEAGDKLLAIAGLVNGVHNGDADPVEAVRAIADVLGKPMEARPNAEATAPVRSSEAGAPAMPELLTYTPSLTDEERDELDGIVADLLLPTFTPRERLIARTAVRLVLKARPVTGAGAWQGSVMVSVHCFGSASDEAREKAVAHAKAAGPGEHDYDLAGNPVDAIGEWGGIVVRIDTTE